MAGAIRTGPVTAEYEAGWEGIDWTRRQRQEAKEEEEVSVAELHEDSEEIEDALAGYTEATDEVPVDRAEMAHSAPGYACTRCGWRLATAYERCGNATCRASRGR